MENHLNRPEINAALYGNTGEKIRYSATLRIDMLYIALPVMNGEDIAGVIRLALPLVSVQQILFTVRKSILLSLLFALGLSFVAASVLAASIVRPLNRIIHGARRFSKGDFGHKIIIESRDEIGELAAGLNKMAGDIEEKIKELEVRNQHLGAILQSMVEGIIAVDRASNIISVNSAAERMFSIKKQDAQDKLFLEVIPNNNIAELIGLTLESRQFNSKEISLAWPVEKIFRVDVSPVFEKETISGCLVVVHDITEIRRLETMRKDFVANVSHELKTPLTSIKGFVETLLEGALQDKENSRQFLKIIEAHAQRLDNLINDLLSLSYLESESISLNKSELKIAKLVDDILAGFKSQLRNKSLEISNNVPAELYVKADKDKLSQVLTNLIDNAIKFNKENGSISIYSEDAVDMVKFTIEDAGIGIPNRDIPRIFERFYRVDKARSRELGGTGLGLSIVKHIVELHGGRVAAESAEGFGSKFHFYLPK